MKCPRLLQTPGIDLVDQTNPCSCAASLLGRVDPVLNKKVLTVGFVPRGCGSLSHAHTPTPTHANTHSLSHTLPLCDRGVRALLCQ